MVDYSHTFILYYLQVALTLLPEKNAFSQVKNVSEKSNRISIILLLMLINIRRKT